MRTFMFILLLLALILACGASFVVRAAADQASTPAAAAPAAAQHAGILDVAQLMPAEAIALATPSALLLLAAGILLLRTVLRAWRR